MPKKFEAPASNAAMTFRDFPGEVPPSEPVAVFVATQPDPVTEEPAKPAVKKEN